MKNQSGRSMIEMLAVLAIIALLSVVGVAAYRYAVSRHEANSTLKQAHEIASDVMFRQQMFSARENGAELIFQGSDKTEMRAFRVDPWVFRVETPALDKDVCSAILRLGPDYPMLLPQTFEADCAETEDGFVANLYFSIFGNRRYAGNNSGGGDDPVIDPDDPDCTEPALSNACEYLVNTGNVDANDCPIYRTDKHIPGDECTTETGKAGTYDDNCKCISKDCEDKELQNTVCAEYEKTGDFDENGCPEYSKTCKPSTIECTINGTTTKGVCSKCECCFICPDDSPFYYNGACHACPAGMKQEGKLCVIRVGRVSPGTVEDTCDDIWKGARLPTLSEIAYMPTGYSTMVGQTSNLCGKNIVEYQWVANSGLGAAAESINNDGAQPLSCVNQLGYAFVGTYGEECHPANTCAAICVVSPEQKEPDIYCQCGNGGVYDETKTCIYPECLGNAYRKTSGECQECPDITTIFNEGVLVEGNGNKDCHCPLDYWWDTNTEKCEACPGGSKSKDSTVYDCVENDCTKAICKNPIYSNDEAANAVCFCPENTDWDDLNSQCSMCPANAVVSENPAYPISGWHLCGCASNSVAKKDSAGNITGCCPEGQYWNGTKCAKASCPGEATLYDASAPTGDTFDVPVSETDFSLGSMTCMCPADKPIYHDGQCKKCSDFVSGAVKIGEGEEINLKEPPLSLVTDQTCYCPSTAPDYDTGAEACQSCPDGTLFSEDSCVTCYNIDSSAPVYNNGVCEECPGNSFTISMDESAPSDPICDSSNGECYGKEYCYCDSGYVWDETAGTCVETLVMCDYNKDGYADDGILDEDDRCEYAETYCIGKCQSKYNDQSLTGSFNPYAQKCDCDSQYGLCNLDDDDSFDGIYIAEECKDCNEYCGSSGSLVQLNQYNGICQCSDMGAM